MLGGSGWLTGNKLSLSLWISVAPNARTWSRFYWCLGSTSIIRNEYLWWKCMESFKRSNGILLDLPHVPGLVDGQTISKYGMGKFRRDHGSVLRRRSHCMSKDYLEMELLCEDHLKHRPPLQRYLFSPAPTAGPCCLLVFWGIVGTSPCQSLVSLPATPHQISAMWNLVPSFAMNTLWEMPTTQYSDVREAQIRSIVWLK